MSLIGVDVVGVVRDRRRERGDLDGSRREESSGVLGRLVCGPYCSWHNVESGRRLHRGFCSMSIASLPDL